MASNNYWMKLWFDILRDPKMGMLPDRLWRRVIELFLLAGQQGEDGLLPDVPTIAWQLNKSVQAINTDLQKIAEVGIIQETGDGRWIVINFKKRNEPVDPAKRIRDFRRRERYEKGDEKCNENETKMKRECYEALQLRNQEEQSNRGTDLTTTTPPYPPESDSKFEALFSAYEKQFGKPPKVDSEEIAIVDAFHILVLLVAQLLLEDFRDMVQKRSLPLKQRTVDARDDLFGSTDVSRWSW